MIHAKLLYDHTHSHVYNIYVYAYVHLDIHIHTRTHTHTYIYIYIYIQLCVIRTHYVTLAGSVLEVGAGPPRSIATSRDMLLWLVVLEVND